MSETEPTENGEEPENEQENEQMAEPVFPQSGPGREEMVSEYLPGSDEWQAKTHLDTSDPAAIAALREFGSIYSEVEELQPLIDEFLDHFMQTKTSVGGMSREEYQAIMQSMYGGKGDGEGSSMAMKLVGAEDSD
jgi:hypothetical protein